MGCCLSSQTLNAVNSTTAKVISFNGGLRQYSVPVTVSSVLESETQSESLFVCNSDKLYFDEHIPPLDPNDQLQVGQIYFVLPISKLLYPLTASDMAGLAVKASAALIVEEVGPRKRSWRYRKKTNEIQILPVFIGQSGGDDDDFGGLKRFEKEKRGGRLFRSGSVRKLQRNASKRAKTAIRSFRMRLSTIYEASVTE